MVADVTHTILAVEDRDLRLLVEVEGTTITLAVEVDTTTTENTVAAAAAALAAAVAVAVAVAAAVAVAEGQEALKAIALHLLQEGMRMTGRDSMAIMEGGVQMVMAIGEDAALIATHID